MLFVFVFVGVLRLRFEGPPPLEEEEEEEEEEGLSRKEGNILLLSLVWEVVKEDFGCSDALSLQEIRS